MAPKFIDREVPIPGRSARRTKTSAFLRGVTRVLSAGGFLRPTPARRRRTVSDDALNLRSDWEAIGADIRGAMKRADRELVNRREPAAR